MNLRFPVILYSRLVSFRTCSIAQSSTRGFERRDQLLVPFRRCCLSNSTQELSQTRIRTPQTPKGAIPKRRPPKPAAYEPLADKLAVRISPTLLYQAPSCTHYLFGCYAVGGGLLAAALFNYRTQFHVRPGGVPRWVPVAVGIGSFMIACGGFWMLLKPHNMVKTISCLSSPAKSRSGSGSLLLQVERNPILPFKQRKLITVPPHDVTISSHLFNHDAEQKLEATIAEITRRDKRLRAFAKANVLTLPFRQAGYWMWRGFIGIRRAFTNEGFHYLHIRGNYRAWKMDKNPVWALDDGKAIDKMVKIKLG